MTKRRFFHPALLLVFILLLQSNVLAQDHTQWGLPNGAKARLGKGRILDIAHSPDGTQLAVASTIGIWLYDVAARTAVTLLRGHTDWVLSVTFSPDGKTLASGSLDETIRLWDTSTVQHKATLNGHGHDVSSLVFSPDGKTLASSGGYDGTIRLWDMETGKIKLTLEGHGHDVSSIAFSPDGKTLASGSWDEMIRLWDADTGEHQQTLSGHQGAVYSVNLSPDGKTLAQRKRRRYDSIVGYGDGKDQNDPYRTYRFCLLRGVSVGWTDTCQR